MQSASSARRLLAMCWLENQKQPAVPGVTSGVFEEGLQSDSGATPSAAGSGTFGRVFRAKYRDPVAGTEEEVAVKMFELAARPKAQVPPEDALAWGVRFRV